MSIYIYIYISRYYSHFRGHISNVAMQSTHCATMEIIRIRMTKKRNVNHRRSDRWTGGTYIHTRYIRQSRSSRSRHTYPCPFHRQVPMQGNLLFFVLRDWGKLVGSWDQPRPLISAPRICFSFPQTSKQPSCCCQETQDRQTCGSAASVYSSPLYYETAVQHHRPSGRCESAIGLDTRYLHAHWA